MIDLHTHTLLSDGELLPSELVRRYQVLGYQAVALTDHVDGSNIDFVVPRVVKIAKSLTRLWDIVVIPGVELTHMPLEEFKPAIKYAHRQGIKLVLVHGETTAEPVIAGTNRKALESNIDILTHPGLITLDEAKLARERGIFLELTARHGHSRTNEHLVNVAREAKAKLILNSDSHRPEDLLTLEKMQQIGRVAGLTQDELEDTFNHARQIVDNLRN